MPASFGQNWQLAATTDIVDLKDVQLPLTVGDNRRPTSSSGTTATMRALAMRLAETAEVEVMRTLATSIENHGG